MSIRLGTNSQLGRNNIHVGTESVEEIYLGTTRIYRSKPTDEYWDFPNPQTTVEGWAVTLGTISVSNTNLRWQNGGTVGSYAYRSLSPIPANSEVEFTFSVANLLSPLDVYLDGVDTGNTLVAATNFQKFIVNVGTASQLRLYGTAGTLGNHVFAKAFFAGVVIP